MHTTQRRKYILLIVNVTDALPIDRLSSRQIIDRLPEVKSNEEN
jgi:hypothetical protein